MGEQAISKKLSIFSVTWPIFFELLLLMLLGNVDILMLSQYSDDSVAAVGVSNQLLQTAMTMFGFVSAGVAVIISQYIGAKKIEDAKRVSVVSILTSLCFGLIVSLAFVFLRLPLLRLMGLESALIPEASFFVLIVGGFIFIQAILLTIGAILRSHGHTRDMLVVTIIMNIFNALGNSFVLFGLFGVPILGVPGIAVVTVFSKLLGLTIAIFMLRKRIPGIFRTINFKKFPFHYIRSILKIGLPTAGGNLSYQGYQLAIIMFVTTLGTTALTTKMYTRVINWFILLFTLALGQGTLIVIGQLTGAKKYDEIYKRGLQYLKIGSAVSLIGAIILFTISYPVLGIFTDNPDILSTGRRLFMLGIILEPGRAFNMILINALRATGDVKFPLYMDIIFMWSVGVLGGYLLGIVLGWGLVGIMIAALMDEWIRGIIMFFRWRSRIWQTKNAVTD